MSSNTKYWIALARAKGIGPANLNTIYNTIKKHNISVSDILDLTHDEIKEEFSFNDKLTESILNAKKTLPRIEEDYFELLDTGIETVLFFEDSYPERFRQILGSSLPPVLYTFGDKNILKQKGAAILGDMNASAKGEEIAYLAARELTVHEIVVISGMAKGIDTIAHRSALENHGKTTAILPYGIKHLKIPHLIQNIYNQDNLLLVSPFYPTDEFNKYNAYIRNRLVCALSYAVYIVECPSESGILEAGKSARKLKIPLYVTEYAEYPESASANKQLMDEFNGIPVKGKMVNNVLTPNMDKLIAGVKFPDENDAQ